MNISALGDFIRDKDKRLRLIVILGMAGMVLIMLSSFIGTPKGGGNFTGAKEGAAMQTVTSYAEEVELKLEKLVSQIEGVGELSLLVTLENGFEQVYAQSGKASQNYGTTYDASGRPLRVEESENSEHAYVLVDASGGKREALLLKQIEPKIKGVVVVCQGAENMVVQERVISAVTTALGIGSNRVCVIKKS